MKTLFQLFFLILFFYSLSSCTINNPNIYRPPAPDTTINQPSAPTNPVNPDISNRDSSTLPYELIPDTIASLTCPGNVYLGSQPYSLVVGAYWQKGLQLHQNFIQNNNIRENTPHQIVRQMIEQSPYRNARAFLALRNEHNVNDYIYTGDRRPIQTFFPPLNNNSSLDLLSKRLPAFATRIDTRNYDQRNVQNSGRWRASLPIEGRSLIHWADDLQPDSSGNLLLTLMYSNTGNTIINRSYQNGNREPYGRSYKLIFNDSFKADYLEGIREENLETRELEGDWYCPEDLKFTVHRSTRPNEISFNAKIEDLRKNETWPEDSLIKEGYCDTNRRSFTRNQQHFFRNEFGDQLPFEVGKTVVYNSEDRTVKTRENCIKFKRATCNPPQGLYRIEFDSRKRRDCKRNSTISNRNLSNEEFSRICPAWFSVCYRKNKNSD